MPNWQHASWFGSIAACLGKSPTDIFSQHSTFQCCSSVLLWLPICILVENSRHSELKASLFDTLIFAWIYCIAFVFVQYFNTLIYCSSYPESYTSIQRAAKTAGMLYSTASRAILFNFLIAFLKRSAFPINLFCCLPRWQPADSI